MKFRFRLLHPFYHRGAAIQHWFRMRIRPAGTGALVVLSLAAFMTIGQPKSSIFLLFSFSFALVIFALGWAGLRSARFSATHELPRHASAGERLRYTVRVRNLGKRRVPAVAFIQMNPDPRPSLSEFTNLPEPGEARRNPFDRTMVYYRWQWLVSRKRLFTARDSSVLLDFPPLAERLITLELTPVRRGIIPIGNLRALLPDPLGFFQKCSEIATGPSRLVVLPRRYRLPEIILPGSSAFRIGGEETSNSIGSSGEFIGLRDYRPGDSLRQIHWKSWAHTGKPVVKELEDTHYPRFGLVLDTAPGDPDEAVFEEMVSVAASFVVSLDRRDSLLDLMFLAGEVHTVTSGRGMGTAGKLLEVLSAASLSSSPDFNLLASSIIRHRDRMTSCLLILNGWDQSRRDFIRELVRSGIPCVPLILGHGAPPDDLIGKWISFESVAADLLRLPGRLSAVTV